MSFFFTSGKKGRSYILKSEASTSVEIYFIFVIFSFHFEFSLSSFV